MSIIITKVALFTCDVQISYNCTLSDDFAFPTWGKESWFSTIVKYFKKGGWIAFIDDDFCVCPHCSKYITKGVPK